MNKNDEKTNQSACYNRIWSWSPMPCEKHGPRATLTAKTSTEYNHIQQGTVGCYYIPQSLMHYVGIYTLRWRHDGYGGVSNHQPHHCLLNRLVRRRSKKTSKFRVSGRCSGNSPVTGEFPAQRASNAENFSTWWRHHDYVGLDRTMRAVWGNV